jgi:type 1 glutamine amidotransferase
MCRLLGFWGMLMAADAVAGEPDYRTLAEAFRVEGDQQPIEVLVVTATHGYRHGPAIEATKRLLGALAETTEFDFEFTEDVDDFSSKTLAPFDLLFLANATLRVDASADQPVTAAHKAAIIEFLKGGGLVVAHSGLDAFYGWEEYRHIVGGGLFESHPWTQQVRILIEDTTSPATAHLGKALTIRDEIYVLDHNPRVNSHILMSLDTASVNPSRTPADASRRDFPISWVRDYQGARVFVTKLGHFPEVWTNPDFIQHLLQGMRMAAGRL